LLATRSPVVLCPAMHTEMWEHPAVQRNVSTLQSWGVHVVQPDEGRLAGGDIGRGRLASADTIVAEVQRAVSPGDLAGLNVLITAGGTREAIDPVRVISNRSTGKQGYALAAEASSRGASVTLVSTVDREAHPGVAVVPAESAADMERVVVPLAQAADVVVMAAAVADFRPTNVADHKIKKADAVECIALEATHDFLVDLGRDKPAGQTLVGFAAETENLEANARGKLEAKRLDLIVANDVSMDGAGFGHDTNEVLILDRTGELLVPMANKRTIAKAVFDAVLDTRGSDPAATDPAPSTTREVREK
ncbi:MAG: bifunctional phosphopantothenoylcysteine decarboxylase/phosphopantothenate--cysteine ligase CoaBC, partial [Acidimicrobiales bacterium]